MFFQYRTVNRRLATILHNIINFISFAYKQNVN